MYVHENMVRILGGYKSLYTPRVYALLLILFFKMGHCIIAP